MKYHHITPGRRWGWRAGWQAAVVDVTSDRLRCPVLDQVVAVEDCAACPRLVEGRVVSDDGGGATLIVCQAEAVEG